tara:strand:+ start:1216 stop:1362 length:147 start_codon:yes stop_codon:yes gene_type:complete
VNVTKKELLIGAVFIAGILILPPELFLISLIGYFLFLSYQNYKDVWKK